MRIDITSSMKTTDGMKEAIEKGLSKLDKYFTTCETHVRVTSDNGTIKMKTSMHTNLSDFRFEVTGEDMYEMVKKTENGLDKAIRRYKDKKIDNKKHGRVEVMPTDEPDMLIRRKEISMKPVFIDDAILSMESLGYDWYLFTEAESMRPAVVYKRKNGGYGVTIG